MPPRGRIDRLLIYYYYETMKFFCEATDIRGGQTHMDRMMLKRKRIKGWTILMNMDALGNVTEFSKEDLANFILDVLKDPEIDDRELHRFLNANFHGSVKEVTFEKISP
jgi:hypothetical protein